MTTPNLNILHAILLALEEEAEMYHDLYRIVLEHLDFQVLHYAYFREHIHILIHRGHISINDHNGESLYYLTIAGQKYLTVSEIMQSQQTFSDPEIDISIRIFRVPPCIITL